MTRNDLFPPASFGGEDPPVLMFPAGVLPPPEYRTVEWYEGEMALLLDIVKQKNSRIHELEERLEGGQ